MPNTILKLTKEDIVIIYDLLINSKMSQREIAFLFNVGEDTISEINHGKTRRQNGYSYPLRQNFHKHYCLKCGKKLMHKNKKSLCKQCSDISQRKVDRPSREILKQKIRTQSFTSIAQEFNVSDNTIKKWCKYENLPYRKKDIKKYSDKE